MDGLLKSAGNSGHQDFARAALHHSLQDFVGKSHPTFLCRDLYQTNKTCKGSVGKPEFSQKNKDMPNNNRKNGWVHVSASFISMSFVHAV